MIPDFEHCYRAVQSKDARFDGWFMTGVTSTGIYCRPSCPALTPKRSNVRFFPTTAAAQAAGFRACKRCRPDASPGSPEWNQRADVVGRAMLLIADGVIEREGVAGLSRRLNYSERHLHRQLTAELGAGPQALARAQRAQTARILIETTDLKFADVAFAAGFASIRQFNDTIKAVFSGAPSELRRKRRDAQSLSPGEIVLRLPFRAPFDDGVLGFIGARAVPGVEELIDGRLYRRTLPLEHGTGTVSLSASKDYVRCVLRLDDLRDLSVAVQRCRRLLDLDSDPVAVDEQLGRDRMLKPLVPSRRGLRIPGTVTPSELAIRAILGQQVSVAAARTLAARLVLEHGKPLTAPEGSLTHLFPAPDAIADAGLDGIGLPAKRGAALRALAGALASERLSLDPGTDRTESVDMLQTLPGIGPWTASYIAMRAMGDPDVFLPTDLGVRRALGHAGMPIGAGRASKMAHRWRPWRSYAVQHLWASLSPSTNDTQEQ